MFVCVSGHQLGVSDLYRRGAGVGTVWRGVRRSADSHYVVMSRELNTLEYKKILFSMTVTVFMQ